MNALKFLILTICLVNFGSADPVYKQKTIDYTKCITDSHEFFIKGIENIVATSDPLSVDLVNGNVSKLKYELKDVKLTGLKNCKVEKFSINKEESSFDYNLECPRLESKAKYVLMGQLDDIYIDGQLDEIYVKGDGNVTITTGYYKLLFHGYFETNIGDNQIKHAQIKRHRLDFEAIDMVVFNFTNLYGGDKEKSDALHKIIRENWRSVEKKLRVPILNDFMNVFIENLNDFLKVTPIEQVISTSC